MNEQVTTSSFRHFFSLFLVRSATYKYLEHFATASASCNLNLDLFLDGPEIPQAAIIFDPNCNLDYM